MYRYSVDNAITYTSEDFVLFRESPFACWMERLTLENPGHGIPPDVGTEAPKNTMERQDDMAATLREEGKDVSLIDWTADEPTRRAATLEAMRKGGDFIVNGQLALGSLSGSANLLMRTSGYSELGDFLYIPCATQAKTTLNSAFRLCFLADLLHSLQGQLPPQMLIIRGGDDLVPLQTEDHIYHYRAVKHLFMTAMRNFRKHRMPDPAESSHFGRWSDCALEVLKQRVLRGELEDGEELEAQETEAQDTEAQETGAQETAADAADDAELPLLQAVGSTAHEVQSPYDLNRQDGGTAPNEQGQAQAAAELVHAEVAHAGVGTGLAAESARGPTLAEQARMLSPTAYSARSGVSRFPSLAHISGEARSGRGRSGLAERGPADRGPADRGPTDRGPTDRGPTDRGPFVSGKANPLHNRRATDTVVQKLEFVGSSTEPPHIGEESSLPRESFTAAGDPPAPNLRDPHARSSTQRDGPAVESTAVEPAAVEPAAVEPAAVEPAAVEPAAVEPAAVEPVSSSAAWQVALADEAVAKLSQKYSTSLGQVLPVEEAEANLTQDHSSAVDQVSPTEEAEAKLSQDRSTAVDKVSPADDAQEELSQDRSSTVDVARSGPAARSVVDLDTGHQMTPTPVLSTADSEFHVQPFGDMDETTAEIHDSPEDEESREDEELELPPFSNSLNTSDEYEY